ncbi:MAG: hypothetical protein ACI88L_000008 [Candidatus Paceibacteria bacterium]|jgi:hypothetical protein
MIKELAIIRGVVVLAIGIIIINSLNKKYV